MLRDLIGAIVFTAAVLAAVDFIGDIAVRPQLTSVSAPAPTPAMETAETATSATGSTPAPETPAVVASTRDLGGDAQKGKKLFRKKCQNCHTMDKGGPDRTGPNLWSIVGRTKASREDFRYSRTMESLGGVWTLAEINSLITRPRSFVPDTKMVFAGLKKEQERADVLAFLQTLTD